MEKLYSTTLFQPSKRARGIEPFRCMSARNQFSRLGMIPSGHVFCVRLPKLPAVAAFFPLEVFHLLVSFFEVAV